MDYQTHIILGLSLYYMLENKIERDERLSLFIGIISPDLEIVLDPLYYLTGILYFKHRAFPHSPFMAPLWIAITLPIFYKLFRAPTKLSLRNYAYALIGAYFSLFLDFIAGGIPLYPWLISIGLSAYTYEDTFVFLINLILSPLLIIILLRNISKISNLGALLDSDDMRRIIKRISKLYMILLILTISLHITIACYVLINSQPLENTKCEVVKPKAINDFEWYYFCTNGTHIKVGYYSLWGHWVKIIKRFVSSFNSSMTNKLISIAKEKDAKFKLFALHNFSAYIIKDMGSYINVTVWLVINYYTTIDANPLIKSYIAIRNPGYSVSVLISKEEI